MSFLPTIPASSFKGFRCGPPPLWDPEAEDDEDESEEGKPEEQKQEP